ncbi:DCC1-like thiol-disulfide oxidoreductase family protein [Flavobacteriaceae bacterium F08102]|nr:DCC1-like thiol-disulfide oxidoreductase family protein [Flavobacteriaceae bacterium F08102]
MISIAQHKIILFDGVCNLCNKSVQFIINHDKKDQFLFGSLQSDAAQEILLQFQLNISDFNTIIYIEHGKVYQKSTAILTIFKRLPGLWKLCYGFIIIPVCFRDTVYQWISNHRYKWFGRKNQCMIPTKRLREKFIS